MAADTTAGFGTEQRRTRRSFIRPVGWLYPIIGFLLTILAFATQPALADTAAAGLFGSREAEQTSRPPIGSNVDVLGRSYDALRAAQAQCAAGPACETQDWQEFLASMDDRDVLEILAAVNAYMNRFRYVSDDRNYGIADYWASPDELFRQGGDCEDYVIAKYASLRALGIDGSQMRLAVVVDTLQDILHAVLVVTVDGRDYVLDNQVADVREASEVDRYRPIYSLNEQTWWVHRQS